MEKTFFFIWFANVIQKTPYTSVLLSLQWRFWYVYCFRVFEIVSGVKGLISSGFYFHISGLHCVFKSLVMSKIVRAWILTLINFFHNFRGGSIRNIDRVLLHIFATYQWWIDTESTFSNCFWYDDSLSLQNKILGHFHFHFFVLKNLREKFTFTDSNETG